MEWTRRTAVFGRIVVVGAVVMTVVGLVLVERLTRTYEDGLEVTQASAALVADAVGPSATLAADLGVLAEELAAGVDAAQDVLASTERALAQVGDAASTNLSELAAGAAGVSDDLAGLIEAIERIIPGDSDSLAEDLRRLADGLEPLSEQLVELGDELTIASAQLGEAGDSLAALTPRIDALAADIDALGPTFEALGVTADDVGTRAADATTRLGLDRWLLRLLVLVGGVVVASLGVVVERFARRLAELEPTAPPPG